MGDIQPRASLLRTTPKQPAEHRREPIAMLTVKEACDQLRISKWSLYRLIRDDQLKTVKIGRRRLISKSSIEEFIRRLEEEPGI